MAELACPRDSKKITHLILPILSSSVYLTPILYRALVTSRSLGGLFNLSAVRSFTDKIALNGPQSVLAKCITDFPAGSVDIFGLLLFSVSILPLAGLWDLASAFFFFYASVILSLLFYGRASGTGTGPFIPVLLYRSLGYFIFYCVMLY